MPHPSPKTKTPVTNPDPHPEPAEEPLLETFPVLNLHSSPKLNPSLDPILTNPNNNRIKLINVHKTHKYIKKLNS